VIADLFPVGSRAATWIRSRGFWAVGIEVRKVDFERRQGLVRHTRVADDADAVFGAAEEFLREDGAAGEHFPQLRQVGDKLLGIVDDRLLRDAMLESPQLGLSSAGNTDGRVQALVARLAVGLQRHGDIGPAAMARTTDLL